jgi:hypothetical protein
MLCLREGIEGEEWFIFSVSVEVSEVETRTMRYQFVSPASQCSRINGNIDPTV